MEPTVGPPPPAVSGRCRRLDAADRRLPSVFQTFRGATFGAGELFAQTKGVGARARAAIEFSCAENAPDADDRKADLPVGIRRQRFAATASPDSAYQNYVTLASRVALPLRQQHITRDEGRKGDP